MKGVLLLLMNLFIAIIVNSQQPKNCQKSCYSLYESISYFWKLDSLGANGYRNEVYKCIIECPNNFIDRDFLLDKLGKPNKISKHVYGEDYTYHYYNGYLIPKEANLAPFIYYITFNFLNSSTYLSAIGTGHD